jgi:hypothetical protein
MSLLVATPLDCQPTHPGFWAEVEAQVRALKPGLVIIDALYLFVQGAQDAMNHATSMQKVMQPLNDLAERTGTAVLIIAHDKKAGGDVAGSFVIRAAAKQILRLTARDPGTPSPFRRLDVEGKLVERTNWTLHFTGPGAWALVDEEANRLSTTKDAVAAWLASGQTGTAAEIAKAVTKRRGDVDISLQQLDQDGALSKRRIGEGRGRRRLIFSFNSGPAHTKTTLGQE